MNEFLFIAKTVARSRKRASTSVLAVTLAVMYSLREDRRYREYIEQREAEGAPYKPIPMDQRVVRPRKVFGSSALGIGLPLF